MINRGTYPERNILFRSGQARNIKGGFNFDGFDSFIKRDGSERRL